MKFYNRIDLVDLFEREHELSDLLAENPDVVGEWIGEEVTLVGREQRFADVRADILFTTTDGRLVEVEVQLGPADDQHLGEIVRHISQREPSVFVWVAQWFDRQMNRVFRQWNEAKWKEAGALEVYTVEIYGVEGTELLGWNVVEQPYTLDIDVDAGRDADLGPGS